MRITKEYHERMTEFICNLLYTYHHAKTDGTALSHEEIKSKSIAEYTGMTEFFKVELELPLLRNYTNSAVSMLLEEIRIAANIEKSNLLNQVEEYLTAASGGSMSRNNSEQLAAELLEKLKEGK